jgi:hypothetical protein
MHFNALTLALCVLSATNSVAARPTISILSLEDATSLRRSAHPIGLHRRGGARAKVEQAEQVSCVLPPVEEKKGEGAVGEEEEDAAESTLHSPKAPHA